MASALFALLTTALIGAMVYGQQATKISGDRSQAVLLADEGIEAVRSIRDEDFANLTDGTFGLGIGGGQWSFAGASDTQGIYTRAITINSIDAVRKSITTAISWNSFGRPKSMSVETILSNWRAAVATSSSWPDAITDGTYNVSGTNDGLKVAVQGDYAYMILAGGNPDFVVFDVSDSTSPSLVGGLSLSGTPANIYVDGNYAYVASNTNSQELQIVDISGPASPSVAATFNASGNNDANGVFVSGDYAYLARDSGSSEMVIINISNPLSPSLVGTYNTSANFYEVTVVGNYAYVTSDNDASEVYVINVGIPAVPVFAGFINLAGTDDALTIWSYGGNRLIIGQGDVVWLYSVSILPAFPTLLSSASLGGTVRDVTGLDNSSSYIFAGSDANGAEFNVIDASNELGISVVRTVNENGDVNGVAYSTNYDLVIGASDSNNREIMIFIPN